MKYLFKKHARVINKLNARGYIIKRGWTIVEHGIVIYYVVSFDSGYLNVQFEEELLELEN